MSAPRVATGAIDWTLWIVLFIVRENCPARVCNFCTKIGLRCERLDILWMIEASEVRKSTLRLELTCFER